VSAKSAPIPHLPEFGESQTYPSTFDAGVGVFSPVAAPLNLNLDYIASESPDMRRVPNMFAGSTSDTTRTLFGEMPRGDEVFGEMPGAHMMFTDEEGTAYMSDLISGGVPGMGFQDAQAVGDEVEETIEVVDADTGKTLGKRRPRVGTAGTHHSKWKNLEDECLIDSWKAVSLDPITDANQTLGKYYSRILDEFNERCHIGEYATIEMNRNEGAISHRWSVIKTICYKFHGNLETMRNRNQSGKSAMDLVSLLCLMLIVHFMFSLQCVLCVPCVLCL
jgi:hypothetical protein